MGGAATARHLLRSAVGSLRETKMRWRSWFTYKLADRTVASLKDLETFEWFLHAGEHDPSMDLEKVSRVHSWEDAVRLNGDAKWDDLRLDWSAELTETLDSIANARYQKWNRIVAKVKPTVSMLVAEGCSRMLKSRGLVESAPHVRDDPPLSFVDSVCWDVLSSCMELEFRDVANVRRYEDLLRWYRLGHWPCGWVGSKTTGSLAVY
jgi:hypothetical protein